MCNRLEESCDYLVCRIVGLLARDVPEIASLFESALKRLNRVFKVQFVVEVGKAKDLVIL